MVAESLRIDLELLKSANRPKFRRVDVTPSDGGEGMPIISRKDLWGEGSEIMDEWDASDGTPKQLKQEVQCTPSWGTPPDSVEPNRETMLKCRWNDVRKARIARGKSLTATTTAEEPTLGCYGSLQGEELIHKYDGWTNQLAILLAKSEFHNYRNTHVCVSGCGKRQFTWGLEGWTLEEIPNVHDFPLRVIPLQSISSPGTLPNPKIMSSPTPDPTGMGDMTMDASGTRVSLPA